MFVTLLAAAALSFAQVVSDIPHIFCASAYLVFFCEGSHHVLLQRRVPFRDHVAGLLITTRVTPRAFGMLMKAALNSSPFFSNSKTNFVTKFSGAILRCAGRIPSSDGSRYQRPSASSVSNTFGSKAQPLTFHSTLKKRGFRFVVVLYTTRPHDTESHDACPETCEQYEHGEMAVQLLENQCFSHRQQGLEV